ncbi:MAG: DUF6519 domain-containing protein [Nitrospira sp.]
MKGDFSRDTYDKAKHFSRVLMQQGRVQLDADWNEQAAILLHYLRTLAADLIGPFAGPAGPHQGFGIAEDKITSEDFPISKGRYYVDGILCENDVADATYRNQKDFPNPPAIELDRLKSCLVYLDVWERHITAVEDEYIREKALGGPDTTSRTKVVWQVKLQETNNSTREAVFKEWKKIVEHWQPQHLGCLKARVKSSQGSTDPCLTAPDAKYRGAENQLYRVEIHKGGSEDEATFKWSRDNGAVVTGCKLEGGTLTVNNPHGFSTGQWVELTNDGRELRGEPGELVKIMNIEGDKFGLEPARTFSFLDKDGLLKVRRWDQSEKKGVTLIDGAVQVTEDTNENNGWIDLENGIQIKFQSHSETSLYRIGDYWLIPARVATGDIEWFPELASKPPHGVRHHYAPLAILTHREGEWSVEECRCSFPTADDKCNLESHGEDGMGGSPSCDANDSADNGRAKRAGKSPSPVTKEARLHKKPSRGK